MTEPLPFTVETERLRMRPYRPGDAELLFETFGDPLAMQYIGTGRPDASLEETRARVERAVAYQAARGLGLFVVEERATGRILGDAGLKLLEEGPDVEVGYRLKPAAWGKGYATEAARASVEWGFRTLGLSRIVAVVRPENGASQRVLEKTGLRLIGDGVYYGNACRVYAIERAEAAAQGYPDID